MKVSRAQADENRERVIEVAGRLFRERGFDGIGIADLMKEAGLTHGGFYGNFKSKDDLIAQASERVLDQAKDRWANTTAQTEEDPFAMLVRFYVSPRHRDETGGGCAVAALAVDASRQGGAIRSAFRAGISSHIAFLSRIIPGASAAAKRKKALCAMSEMVGALVLARATKDDALSDEILDAVASHLTSLGPRRSGSTPAS